MKMSISTVLSQLVKCVHYVLYTLPHPEMKKSEFGCCRLDGVLYFLRRSCADISLAGCEIHATSVQAGSNTLCFRLIPLSFSLPSLAASGKQGNGHSHCLAVIVFPSSPPIPSPPSPLSQNALLHTSLSPSLPLSLSLSLY